MKFRAETPPAPEFLDLSRILEKCLKPPEYVKKFWRFLRSHETLEKDGYKSLGPLGGAGRAPI